MELALLVLNGDLNLRQELPPEFPADAPDFPCEALPKYLGKSITRSGRRHGRQAPMMPTLYSMQIAMEHLAATPVENIR